MQASDFVPTPLAEDQGAITRFFNGNQPQKAGETLCTGFHLTFSPQRRRIRRLGWLANARSL